MLYEKLLFLDFDGVLNDHKSMPNKARPIFVEKVALLNWILAEVPGLELVITSSWRASFSTSRAMEHLLMIHGCECEGRIHGLLDADIHYHGGKSPDWKDAVAWRELTIANRAFQIQNYLQYKTNGGYLAWAIVDDLPITTTDWRFVQTKGDEGLSPHDCARLVEIIQEQEQSYGDSPNTEDERYNVQMDRSGRTASAG